MADKYKSTLLAQNSSPEEIQKADLDLLKKINEVANITSNGSSATNTTNISVIKPVLFIGDAIDVAAGATYINYGATLKTNRLINIDNAMNLSTGIWTCPEEATYRITVTRSIISGTEGRDITQLYLNNSLYTEIVECWGQYDDIDGSVTLTLFKGDQIKIVKHPSISKTGTILLQIEKIQVDTIIASEKQIISSTVDKPLMSGQIGSIATFSAAQKIPFDDIWVNVGGIRYDSVNRRFYIPKTGKYRITMNPLKNTGATATKVLIGINNDTPTGANNKGMTYSNASVYDSLCLDSVVDLTAGDYIVFYLLEGSIYNTTENRYNQFSIEYIEPAYNQINIYQGDVQLSSRGAIVNSYSETDIIERSFSTAWADSLEWGNFSYSGNSKLYVTLHIPGRINSGTSWSGWYTELQYRIDGGTWMSLGQSGYDSMMLTTTGSITNNNYHFLIPLPPKPCSVQFKTRHRAYTGTLVINGQHEIIGNEFYSKLIILEIANDQQNITPSYGAYYRPAFYRYYNRNSVANQYIHLKTNQTINNVMFAVQFQGYEYGSSKPIDATVVGYPYIPNNDVINKGTSGTHTCGAYKSSDGYVVLTIFVTSLYFLGFILNQIGAGPQGLFPLVITATTNSASATGVY